MAWEIEPAGDGVSKLTVITSGVVVCGLKTYLETGEPMTPVEAEAAAV